MNGTIKLGRIQVKRLAKGGDAYRPASYDEIRIDGIEFPAVLGDCQPKHLEKRITAAVRAVVNETIGSKS